ncbi:MAG: hypothetical protein IT323_19790 [Anaerolineae bacterium]|nr:hypothetical protein [Anaerolineae bacterium]
MFQQKTQAAAYWTKSFRVSKADIDYLFAQFLENETPLTSREVALTIVRHRVKQEHDRLRKLVKKGEVFQPRKAYQVGQELIFPASDFAQGKVVSERPGRNHEIGEFTVIEVDFGGSNRREFASALPVPHALNLDEDGGQELKLPTIDPEEVMAEFGESIIDEVEARLVDEPDAIFVNGRWFLKSLLADVNIGHLHLAEAILDLAEGKPLPTTAMMDEIGLSPEVSPALREYSLDVALSQDDRFDNVGSAGKTLWFLRRLEPPEVVRIPPRLEYRPEPYDAGALTDELRALEAELADEFSPMEPPETPPSELTVTLIYPHRRVGALPMNAALERMLPAAGDSPRIWVTLVDEQTGDEFAGWVMREGRYVFGLSDFYRRHKLPIGAYVTIKRTDDVDRLIVSFSGHRARTEYIRLAIPNAGRLHFENFKRSIGAVYDELLILGAEDIDGVDDVWAQTRQRNRRLHEIMADLIPELARLNPQNAVHAKTLYSAINIIRRTPPGPIFAALVARPEFQHVGGPYWRMAADRQG